MNVMAPLARTVDDDPQTFKLRLEHVELLQREGSLAGRRVELINGMLFEMSPQQRPHSYTKNELNRRLWAALDALGSPLSAEIEVTLPVGAHDAPEPDIALTTSPSGQGYIPADTVALVIEVAGTTLRYDLGDKRGLYAVAGIAEYWVVDVVRREVHQFWGPRDDGYDETRTVPLAGPIASATIPDLAIDGTGIL